MKLLFPEVEVTKSLSSNLFKAGWVVVGDHTRVINTNDLVEQKVREAAAKRQTLSAPDIEEDESGFSAGLEAERVDALLDQDGEEAVQRSASMEAQAQAELALQEATEQLEQAKAQAAKMLEDADSEIQGLKYQAKEEAKTQGYQAGYEEGMAQAQALKDEYTAKQKQLEQTYRQMIEELEPTFIETLTGIYEHIFKVDLSAYSPLVTELVIDAMQKSESKKNYIIHCSKEDYPAVSQDKDRILEETGTTDSNVEIISDMTLTRSQCMIETDGGVYDCSLGTELAELKRKMILLSYKK